MMIITLLFPDFFTAVADNCFNEAHNDNEHNEEDDYNCYPRN
jgi:hypothetical protein